MSTRGKLLQNLALTGLGLGAAGLATLVYGALVESKRLTLERRFLELPNWPKSLNGYKVAVLADLHMGNQYARELAERAVALALQCEPDIVIVPGDIVSRWQPGLEDDVKEVLSPLTLMEGRAILTLGNRDYVDGTPDVLADICSELNIRFLRNEAWHHAGINWVGIDSAKMEMAEPERAMGLAAKLKSAPIVTIWHEPDVVDELPEGASLMISGHSHGGQFIFPGGWAPIYTKLGERYPQGFYPEASTPLYVSRGIGTTGPPSRLNCPPEVSLLTLLSLD